MMKTMYFRIKKENKFSYHIQIIVSMMTPIDLWYLSGEEIHISIRKNKISDIEIMNDAFG